MSVRARELWQGVRRHGRVPAMLVLGVTVLAVAISFVLPKWYSARASLMPPEQSGETFGLLTSLIEGSALSKVGLITASSPSDLYAAILRSRRVGEAIVERFELRERYRESNLDRCLQVLEERVSVEVLPSRIIEIRVEDRDPEVSAEMANALIEELHRVDRDVHAQRASRTREFLEAQIEDAERRLQASEARLTSYERQHGVITSLDQAAVQGAADLYARKLALQVRRSWMQSYVERDSPTLRSIDTELAALESQMARLPSIKQEAARLALDLEIQRRVYALLNAQHEESRIRERSSVPTISILDPARPPTIHSRPRKALVVGVTFLVALLLAGAWVIRRTRQDLEESGRLLA